MNAESEDAKPETRDRLVFCGVLFPPKKIDGSHLRNNDVRQNVQNLVYRTEVQSSKLGEPDGITRSLVCQGE